MGLVDKKGFLNRGLPSTMFSRAVVLWTALSSVLLLGGCHRGSNNEVNLANPDSMPVMSSNIKVPGVVDTTQRMVIAAPNQGVLTQILVGTGKWVSVGDVLARLNAQDATIRRDQAAQRLAAVQREKQEVLARWRAQQRMGQGVRPAPATTRSDRSADIAAANVNLEYAKAELARAKAAYSSREDLRDAVTNADFSVQAAEQAVDGSLSRMKAAEANLPLAENRHVAVKQLYDDGNASRE